MQLARIYIYIYIRAFLKRFEKLIATVTIFCFFKQQPCLALIQRRILKINDFSDLLVSHQIDGRIIISFMNHAFLLIFEKIHYADDVSCFRNG